MTRVKRGTVARKRRNKILELNRGFRGSHSTLFRTANQRSLKALSSSYSDRRKKKRHTVVYCLDVLMRGHDQRALRIVVSSMH